MPCMSAAGAPMSGASFKLIPRDQPPRSDFAALPFHTDRRAPLSVGVVSDADLSDVSFHVDRELGRAPVDPASQLVALHGLLRHLDREWRPAAKARSAAGRPRYSSSTAQPGRAAGLPTETDNGPFVCKSHQVTARASAAHSCDLMPNSGPRACFVLLRARCRRTDPSARGGGCCAACGRRHRSMSRRRAPTTLWDGHGILDMNVATVAIDITAPS